MRWVPLIIGVLVSAVLGFAFFQLAGVYESSPAVLAFDMAVAETIQAARTPALTALMRLLTFLGGTLAVTTMTIALMATLWLRGHRPMAWYVGVVGVVGAFLTALFKEYFYRARPPAESALIALPSTFSFPSGHTVGSMCLAWAVGYVMVRSTRPVRLKVAVILGATAYALGVAVSRVYLGVHWPSDVVAGWLLGGAWVALATGVYEFGRLTVRVGTAE